MKETWDRIWSPPRTWSLLQTIVELSAGGLIALVFAWLLWGCPIRDEGARATMSLATVGGLSGLVALIVAYRKQASNERQQALDERKQDEIERNEVDGKLTDAVHLLGEERPSTRIAGVYALMNVGDLHPDRRQQIIDILCGYLRTKRDHNGEKDGPTESTIITALHSRLNASSWSKDQAINLDLHDATFTELFNFNRVKIHALESDGTKFKNGATFNNAEFGGVIFSGATFDDAKYGDVEFNSAIFSGATFNNSAIFNNATFNGDVKFNNATFNGDARFNGAIFNNATRNRDVLFNNATFNGDATFNNASFDDKTLVDRIRSNATFTQPPSFKGIRFKNGADGGE